MATWWEDSQTTVNGVVTVRHMNDGITHILARGVRISLTIGEREWLARLLTRPNHYEKGAVLDARKTAAEKYEQNRMNTIQSLRARIVEMQCTPNPFVTFGESEEP